MIVEYSKQLIVIAVVLLLFGVLMPFLMVIHLVESTFFMNFLSFGASVLGLLLGLVGIAGSRLVARHKEDENNRYK
ncbi:MAG TPA: hypothetical protein DEP47_00450 [Chloroflexi bacterium]|nr:hypothetical protein [Chloroflexota bacterium]